MLYRGTQDVPGFLIKAHIAGRVWDAHEESQDSSEAYPTHAMKLFPLVGAVQRSLFNREVEIWNLSEHENVVGALEIFEFPDRAVILMERANQSLEEVLLSRPQGLDSSHCARVFYQVCSAIQDLHAKHIAHLHITPRHILLIGRGRQAHAKLTDFGHARKFEEDVMVKSGPIGDEFYRAPEVQGGKAYLPSFADVWSLGVLLHIMLTGTLPFEGFDERESKANAARGRTQLAVLASEQALLLQQMLQYHPKERPTLEAVLQDPWVQSGKPTAPRQLNIPSEALDDLQKTLLPSITPLEGSPDIKKRNSVAKLFKRVSTARLSRSRSSSGAAP